MEKDNGATCFFYRLKEIKKVKDLYPAKETSKHKSYGETNMDMQERIQGIFFPEHFEHLESVLSMNTLFANTL